MGRSRANEGTQVKAAHWDVDSTKLMPPVRLYAPGDVDWLGLYGPASWVRCDDNQCSLDAMAVGDAARAGMLPPLAREVALQRAELIRQGKRPKKAGGNSEFNPLDRMYALMDEETRQLCVGVDGIARRCSIWMQKDRDAPQDADAQGS